MLDDQDGVADVGQVTQGPDQPLVIALVQPDAGLVQNVGDPRQLTADLRCQPDALGLAPGKGAAGAVQAQVPQPYVQQEL